MDSEIRYLTELYRQFTQVHRSERRKSNMKKRMAALMLTMAMAAAPVSAYAADASQTLSVAVTAEVKTLVQWAAAEEQASLVNNQAQDGLFR